MHYFEKTTILGGNGCFEKLTYYVGLVHCFDFGWIPYLQPRSGENRNTPDDALWPGYTVTAETPPAFVFTSRTKGAIAATVQGAGTYTYVGDVLGAPAYLNREQNHLLGWRGDR